ncbi:MAG: hypothetical protein JWM73_991, partial [Solirubrobacterales bacterium]|nr:hypothetical protein [Solirubrobacterales bacterium]
PAPKPAAKKKPKPAHHAPAKTPAAAAAPTPLTAAERVAASEEASREAIRERYGTSEGLVPQILHVPRGVSVVLLEPLPWQAGGSLSLNLARIESIVWFPLIALALLGLTTLRWRHRRILAFPLLSGGAVLIVYAITEGNIGTAFRHRGELIWIIAILAGMGFVELRRRWAEETVRRRARQASGPQVQQTA